jgi:mannose-6-phosphate isomerase
MSIRTSVEELRLWTVDEALPFWGRTGFDEARSSFVERIDFSGAPVTAAPRRAMVQSRQIYVFAHAALLGWWSEGRSIALAAAQNLISLYHEPDGRPGWVFSVKPDGEIYDPKRDLYSHSFVLFGLAWAYRLEQRPKFREVALKTIAHIDSDFASPTGGYYTQFPPAGSDRQQNPHMHFFEAMIAWYEATGDATFLARATELYGMMVGRFVQARTGVLVEYFDESWLPKHGIAGRICEPGHQYEWSWLLRQYDRMVGEKGNRVAEDLYVYANRHGFDAEGFVVDELLDDGTVHKSSRRCWPQTEAIKADVAAFEGGDARAAMRAQGIIKRLMQTFLGRPVPAGWIDHINAAGNPIVEFMPASTLYHVFLATAEADRVWGQRVTAP